MSELTLNDSNFEEQVLKSSTPVFVDFWAPWCGPCQMMGPIVEELAKEFSGQGIKIGKLNVDESQATAGKYEIMSIPTFIVFKNGQPAEKMMGGLPKEKLAEMIKRHLN